MPYRQIEPVSSLMNQGSIESYGISIDSLLSQLLVIIVKAGKCSEVVASCDEGTLSFGSQYLYIGHGYDISPYKSSPPHVFQ